MLRVYCVYHELMQGARHDGEQDHVEFDLAVSRQRQSFKRRANLRCEIRAGYDVDAATSQALRYARLARPGDERTLGKALEACVYRSSVLQAARSAD